MVRVTACLVLALLACERKRSAPSTPQFCTVEFAGTNGPMFRAPALVGGALAESVPTWRWINVWATWCSPCIDEMPLLVKWHEKLGKKFELAFVSIDEDETDVVAFRKAHPEAPPSPRLADPSKQGDWYVSLGLEAKAVVPMQVFVAPSGHIRCVREGTVSEQEFPDVEKLLAQ
jgi:thiol-disulfide isomerase/thioredoxin